MKIRPLHLLLFLIWVGFTACENKSNSNTLDTGLTNAQRLVVQGYVTNEAGSPLPDIHVTVYGIRETDEPDILSYNYAVTDEKGHYIICRYRGRRTDTQFSIVAYDPKGYYSEQTKWRDIPEATMTNSIVDDLKVNFVLSQK